MAGSSLGSDTAGIVDIRFHNTDVINSCAIYNSDFTRRETYTDPSYAIIIRGLSDTAATPIYVSYNNEYYPYEVTGGQSYSIVLDNITTVVATLGPISSIMFNNEKHEVHDARIKGVDSTPTAGSENVVTSGGVATAMSGYLPLTGGKMNTDAVVDWNIGDYGSNPKIDYNGVSMGDAHFKKDELQLVENADGRVGGLRVDDENLHGLYRSYDYTFPKKSGTIALTSDVPSTYAGSPTVGGPANKTLGIPFGNVDAGSTATEMTATVDNFPETLTDGVCAYIRNNVIASAAGWTLNINGTGALPVYASNADAGRVTTVFSAATTYLFVYNSSRVTGGCWDIYYGYDSNTNTIGHNIRTDQMSMPTTSACYRYRLLFTSADHTHFVPANASSSTNATASRTTTQTPIDPFGSIRYYGYTKAVSSGARPDADYLWEQYAITLGYSFNRTGAALALTAWKPVYIKCTPQANGSAIIDADTPFVQALPSTKDGEIYIYLGVAYNATNVELTLYHPVYYHDGTRVTNWPGVSVDDIKSSIGDIQTALDAIIGQTLISFKIDTNTYQAEEGMTWEQWVASAYNTNWFFINGSRICVGNNEVVANLNDVIVANHTYYVTASSGGGND